MTNHIDLMDTWNEMDNAAQRVTTSLPDTLSQAVANLDKMRLAMRRAVQNVVAPRRLQQIVYGQRDIRSGGEAEGPSTSGYWTAGIDSRIEDWHGNPSWHLHAMEFHHKDKAEAERMRDLALVRLGY